MGIMLRTILLKSKKLRANSKQKKALRIDAGSYRRLYSALIVNDDTFDTQLHSIINNGSSLHTVIDTINQIPREQVAQMARTTNNAGKLPLDLINNMPLVLDDQDQVTGFLLNITNYETNFKPFNEPVSASDTLKKYYSDLDENLNDHLQLACSVANKSRSTVKVSTTHPDFNKIPFFEQDSIRSKLQKARDQRSSLKNQISPFDEAKLVTSLSRVYEVGNCDELSYIAIDCMKDISKKPLNAYVVGYDNGDHVFVIFASHPIADPNQYNVKNTQMTLCDPWAGVVGKFYRDDLTNILGDYKAYFHPLYDKYYNVVSTFNPHYHRMTILNSFNITGSLMHERTFVDLKLSLFSGTPKSDDNNIKKVDDAVSQQAEITAKPSTP